MKAHRATVIAGVVVAAIVALSFVLTRVLLPGGSSGELVVRIHDSEGIVYEYPLDEDGTYEVRTSLGANVIAVEDGSVRMADADCPHQSCMDQRPLTSPGAQIICLPHQLWVEVAAAGGDNATALDESLVDWSDDSDYDTVAR